MAPILALVQFSVVMLLPITIIHEAGIERDERKWSLRADSKVESGKHAGGSLSEEFAS